MKRGQNGRAISIIGGGFFMAKEFIGLLVFTFLFSMGPSIASADDQIEHITPDHQTIQVVRDSKHTPKIEAPDQVKEGQWFPVTITVGVDSLHPMIDGHMVQWLILYKDQVELARIDYSLHLSPKVTFFIALDETSTVRALARPNHSAAWEAKKEIRVTHP